MKKVLFLIASFSILLIACASLNPHNVPEGKGAYLKNRIIYKGTARFSYFFKSAGGKKFSPDFVTAEGEAIYKIPSGETVLGLLINYAPKVATGLSVEKQYEIYVFEKIGKQLLLNALEGRTYQINCKIKGGKAYIWIEEVAGERVTDIKVGYGFHYPEYFIWENLPPPTS